MPLTTAPVPFPVTPVAAARAPSAAAKRIQQSRATWFVPCHHPHGGELHTTRLTWVVGAAIRPAVIENVSTAKKLLQSLGASLEQTSLVGEQCPGLGQELTWALYLDRHGWLSASPVPSDGDLTWLLNQEP